jgi:hypothetical protein
MLSGSRAREVVILLVVLTLTALAGLLVLRRNQSSAPWYKAYLEYRAKTRGVLNVVQVAVSLDGLPVKRSISPSQVISCWGPPSKRHVFGPSESSDSPSGGTWLWQNGKPARSPSSEFEQVRRMASFRDTGAGLQLFWASVQRVCFDGRCVSAGDVYPQYDWAVSRFFGGRWAFIDDVEDVRYSAALVDDAGVLGYLDIVSLRLNSPVKFIMYERIPW